MPRITQEKRIGEHLYRVTQLPLVPARKALVLVTRVLGGFLGEMAGAVGARSLGDIDTSVLGAALGRFTSTLSDDDLSTLQRTFSEGAWVSLLTDGQGKPVWAPMVEATQEEAFAGHLSELFAWLWFCLEVNFADFLGGIKALNDRVSDKGKTKSA